MGIIQTIRKVNFLLDNKTKFKLIFIFFAILIGAFFELVGVAIVLPIVELAMKDVNVESNIFARTVSIIFGVTDKEIILIILILITVILYIVKAVYLVALSAIQYKFSMNIKRNISVKLLESCLAHPYEFFLNSNTADLLRTITSDTNDFYQVVINVLMIATNGFTATAICIYLLITNVVITLVIALALLICAGAIILVLNKRYRKYGVLNHDYIAILNKALLQTLNGVKEIKIIGNEKFFISKYNDNLKKQAGYNTKFQVFSSIPKQMIEVVCISGILLYMAYNILFTGNYSKLMTQIAVFCVGAYKLLPSVNAIMAYTSTVLFNKASVDCIYENIVEANKYLSTHTVNSIDDNTEKKIEFNNVFSGDDLTFKYKNSDRYVLKDVDIRISKGESVGFIGVSGGGKTTLADIMIGLLIPEKGKVKIDGVDINEYRGSIGGLIGYIPQQIYLTDDSIMNNVAFGINENQIDENKVWQALKKAKLDDFVASLPKGIETEVGERGTRLSGGQRQRIGIARALYRNPDILVLDEATSALDNETEKEVMSAINGLKGSKTIIMIAHRLSTIKNCDTVYEVKNGAVVKRNVEDIG